MLVSRRYERASLIVTSNKRFSAWGETFGDDMAAVAMVDRLIDHAELISLKGDSYRPKDRDLGQRPTRPGDTPRPERPPAFRSARLPTGPTGRFALANPCEWVVRGLGS